MAFKKEEDASAEGFRIVGDEARLSLGDLYDGLPGLPPWRIGQASERSIERFLNQKGLSVDSFHLDGEIITDNGHRVPVTIKVIERPRNAFHFYAYPREEEPDFSAEPHSGIHAIVQRKAS